jgi:AraC-like DNA-binding protein
MNTNGSKRNLAREFGYGQRQLRRMIKKLTGLSPVSFILELRLQKAFQLLDHRRFLTV